MGRVIHFELTAEQPAQLTGFLAAAFGWTQEESPFLPGYHLVDTGEGEGIDGAVMSSAFQKQPVIIWLLVEELDAALEAVAAAGGAQAGPVNEIPGRGRLVYVMDPSGTVFGLREAAERQG